jgi:hypothetical protein
VIIAPLPDGFTESVQFFSGLVQRLFPAGLGSLVSVFSQARLSFI